VLGASEFARGTRPLLGASEFSRGARLSRGTRLLWHAGFLGAHRFARASFHAWMAAVCSCALAEIGLRMLSSPEEREIICDVLLPRCTNVAKDVKGW
jgi:hypothetical protein